MTLFTPDIEPIAWATAVWAESSTPLRVGQVFWGIESAGRTIVGVRHGRCRVHENTAGMATIVVEFGGTRALFLGHRAAMA